MIIDMFAKSSKLLAFKVYVLIIDASDRKYICLYV